MKNNFTVHFKNHSIVKVEGQDRVSFLNNILSQDIKSMKPAQSSLSAFLTAQGKVLLYMNILLDEDRIWLAIEGKGSQGAIELLDKFLITEDVQMLDATNDYTYLWTTDASLVIQETLSYQPTHIHGAHSLLPSSTNLPDSVVLDSSDEYEEYRIKHGIPKFGIDFDEDIMLPEAGLEKIAASETKGCYPGQEVVARIETYKGLNRKLVRIESQESHLSKGAKITDSEGNEIGRMTSSFGRKGLGFVKKNFFEKETTVQIKCNEALIQGKILVD